MEWFAEWFDSPYYHILYTSRNVEEARFFIDNLIDSLSPTPAAKMLDLACGKGRHSIYLNSKGFDVTGADLSPQSIQHANQFANDQLRFVEHDMREVLAASSFDYVFNLFTSFGYFEDPNDNIKVLKAVEAALKPGGVFVLDFLNAERIIQKLVPEEEKTVNGILFKINRFVRNGMIVKSIAFEHRGKAHHYEEQVEAITLQDFQHYFDSTALEIIDTFGAHSLTPYQPEVSERLILVARKPA